MKTANHRLCVYALQTLTSVILLLFSHFSFSQPIIDYGKTYVNITKGSTGGTIEPGDILEIRATFVIKQGASAAASYADSCAFFDAVPAGTTYQTGTLAVLTNEGKIFRSFTDAAGDDAGWISGSSIQINLGYNAAPQATAFKRGRVRYSDKPSFYGGSCIMVASYRVKVNAASVYGTVINIGGGSISYKPSTGVLTAINFGQDNIMVFKNYGLCANTVGSNAIVSESNGTFGSGKPKNRAPSAKVPNNYTYATFSANMPNDYYYGVSNNTSVNGAGYSTSNAWAYPDNSSTSHRVFRVWDIIGDHTGAASPTAGNPATDTVNSTGGYMVVINASYKTDTAFSDTVTNLCPNTYYEYSAWFRNICKACGCDSNGVGATSGNSAYKPTGPGDSSGVHPNLTFNVNGYNYYTTGDMAYTGQWVKKGFVYLTGPTQTSMIVNIRNNAPGGGGNDWAIDDIKIASCSPNITLTPAKPDTLCMGGDDTIRFKVTCFFNNYTEWKLEKSTDGGLTWSSPGIDTTGAPSSGSATPVFNTSTNQYEYLITRYYRLNWVDAEIRYRLTVASTTGNLSNPNCAFVATAPKIIRTVNCLIVLPTGIEFKGGLNQTTALLQWISSNETGNIRYVIERSNGDQAHFRPIATVNGHAQGNGDVYAFTDPVAVAGPVYYRINITDGNYSRYSKIILLSTDIIDLELKSLVNPFISMISFDMIVPDNQPASFMITDACGRLVRVEKQNLSRGINNIRIYGLNNLSDGVYILKVQYQDKLISKRMIKMRQ